MIGDLESSTSTIDKTLDTSTATLRFSKKSLDSDEEFSDGQELGSFMQSDKGST